MIFGGVTIWPGVTEPPGGVSPTEGVSDELSVTKTYNPPGANGELLLVTGAFLLLISGGNLNLV
jgi:hypothetical protein